jgi:glycosyltransferase involved in cell wall biosynthesis
LSSLFLNSGLLGHHSVAEIFQEVTAHLPALDAHHVNLSQSLTTRDRVLRKLLTLRLPLRPGSNADLARFRTEFSIGLIAARHIREFERTRNLTLLHFHTQPAAYASLAHMRRTPSIVSIDATQELMSLEAPEGFQRRTYWPNIARDRHVYRAARAIVATSQWAARDLARNYPESAAKVTVIPYPVRFQWFPEPEPRAEGKVVFLFMGGDFPRKGGPQLLDVWRQIQPDNAVLRIATGPHTVLPQLPPAVEAIIGTKPHTPEWQRLWREADVFVMPTRAEAFGMVYQEAAAAGLPAIGTRLNAIPEIIVDGETGWLVTVDDSRELAQAIRTLANSRELRLSMGAKARARMLRIGTTAHYAGQLAQLIPHAAVD